MFAPYQVDYNVKNASKTFGFSKKRVTFKFGVANPEALAQGLTGAHCRGSEHEIIFIWSLNSGKRQIIADGKDVHFSESGMNGWTTDQVFQHHFNLRVPNFDSPVRCHLVTQPANKDNPSVRPFDIRVNGISFFRFSKIFQLGTPEMTTRPLKGSSGSRGGNPEDDPYITPEERKAIAAAKLASIREMREPGGGGSGGGYGGGYGGSIQSAPAVMNRDEGNLINLLDDPIPSPPAQNQPSQFVSSMTMDTTFGASPAPAPYGQPPQQPYSNYSLGAPPQQNPYAQQQPAYGQPPEGYSQPPPPQQQQQQQQYGQAPPQSNSSFASAYQQPPPVQAGYGAPPPQNNSGYGAGFGSPPPNNMMSPMGQSVASYGSAPSFAQPPRTAAAPPEQQQYQQQYQGFPQY